MLEVIMLNEQQIKNYQKDGYIIPDFKMPEEDLLEIENLHDHLIKKHPKYLNYCPAILQYDERFLKYCLNKKILDFVDQAKKIIKQNNSDAFRYLLNETWYQKRELSKLVSNTKIDYLYQN